MQVLLGVSEILLVALVVTSDYRVIAQNADPRTCPEFHRGCAKGNALCNTANLINMETRINTFVGGEKFLKQEAFHLAASNFKHRR